MTSYFREQYLPVYIEELVLSHASKIDLVSHNKNSPLSHNISELDRQVSSTYHILENGDEVNALFMIPVLSVGIVLFSFVSLSIHSFERRFRFDTEFFVFVFPKLYVTLFSLAKDKRFGSHLLTREL